MAKHRIINNTENIMIKILLTFKRPKQQISPSNLKYYSHLFLLKISITNESKNKIKISYAQLSKKQLCQWQILLP